MSASHGARAVRSDLSPRVRFRAFRSADFDFIVSVAARGLPADPISADWLAEYVLLEPNFDPDGLIVAADETSDRVLGFCYAVRAGTGPALVDPDGAWITILVVDPDARRQGIGSGLVTQALDYLRRRGARRATVAGYPPAYFLPGVDADAYPDGLRLLEASGFETTSRPVAMDLSLATYRTQDAVRAQLRTREAEGFTFAPAGMGDLPEVIRFVSARFAPDWGQALRDSVIRFGRPERTVVAREPGGGVVGFATYGAYRGLVERFGPFGVAESQRGRGLGTVLLHLALARMRGEGAHSAWFLWTGEQTAAGRLYQAAGFTVTRRFHVMRAPVSPDSR
jgi:mycothiol synthase